MSDNLSARPSLLIVSDTAIWSLAEQVIVFEPVVREVENLTILFNNIVWIGYRYDNSNQRKNARAINGIDIKYLLLPRVGGNKFIDKLLVLASLPRCFWTIWKATRNADVIHSRGPSLPAFCCIIISFFNFNKLYWHKYAGNWNSKNKPFFYRVQKWLLQINRSSKVTINGKWDDQPTHILSMENPCLTDEELDEATIIANRKDFSGKLILLFVGRITEAKGVGLLLQMLSVLSDKSLIQKVILVGDGNISTFKTRASSTGLDVQFTGAMSRGELNRYYGEAHIFLLPSLSEGFPKVVAEAAAYGCVPVVTNVSALSQYISDTNGLLFKSFDPQEMSLQLETLLANRIELAKKSQNIIGLAKNFTYSYYLRRIQNEVI